MADPLQPAGDERAFMYVYDPTRQQVKAILIRGGKPETINTFTVLEFLIFYGKISAMMSGMLAAIVEGANTKKQETVAKDKTVQSLPSPQEAVDIAMDIFHKKGDQTDGGSVS
jgi:hypothetical protein